MSHSKLEVASWIAGIASAIIALVTLLPTSKSSTETQPPPQKQSTPQLTQDTSSKSASTKLREDKNNGLVEALSAAKDITAISARDEQLYALTREGIRRREFQYALSAANGITSIATRDKALYALTCWTMNLQGNAEARKAASAITSIALRDEALRMVANNAATDWGGSEGGTCNEL